ncbi:MAG: hypothetical protein WCJ73_04190 [Actinomycetes bacterium]
MRIETTTLLQSGIPHRKVLFSDETARGLHRADDRTRAGIWRSAIEVAEWARTLVFCQPDAKRLAPRPEDGEVEVR